MDTVDKAKQSKDVNDGCLGYGIGFSGRLGGLIYALMVFGTCLIVFASNGYT